MRTILIFLVLLIFQNTSFSQTIESEIDSLNYYESNFQYLKAVFYLDKVYKKKEMPTDLLKRKAVLYNKIGKIYKAESLYRNIYNSDTLAINTGIDLAMTLSKQKKFKEAQLIYESLIKVDSSNFYLNRNLALIYFKNKKPYKSINTYLLNYNIDSTDIGTIDNISKIFLKQEHSGKASNWASKGLIIDPKNKRLLYTKAKAEHLQKDYKKAIKNLNKILVQSDTTKAYIRLSGVCNYDLKKYNKAIFWFSKLNTPLNESEVIHYYLGKCYQELDNNAKAEKHLKKAIVLGTSAYMASYYELLAYNYIDQKKYNKAINVWKKLHVLNPDIKYLYYVGNIYETYLKDYKLALDNYEKALTIKSDKTNKYYGNAYLRSKKMRKQLHLMGELN